jgi:hypothetical protein
VLEQPDQPYVLDVESAVSELDPVPIDVADRLEPISTLEAGVPWLLRTSGSSRLSVCWSEE